MATPLDIQQQVYDLISRTSDISFVSVEQEAVGRVTLSPGQRVSAEVLMTLPNNRTQVQIGNDRFNLELPMAVRPGQKLEMTFISEDPRSTFAIARQAGTTPPVSLSDASRLLSMLVSNEQIVDPKVRSSLQNIGDMLRHSSGEAGVLANLMDEALTYGATREAVRAPAETPGDSMKEAGERQGPPLQNGSRALTPDQARLTAFESNAAQILKNLAQNSRFLLTEATGTPAMPLPLMPGQEVNASVVSTLPGGRAFVQVAGMTLELVLPRLVQAGESLRLTYITSQPRPLFAMPRTAPDAPSGLLSDAGRWLSVLEHSDAGASEQQRYVLERLSTVLKSLPPDSPAFTAILDEAITYQTVFRGKTPSEQSAAVQTALLSAQQTSLTPGNGIVLNDDMAKLLQAVIKGNRLTLLETLDQKSAPAGLVPGQQVKGEVLEARGNDRFVVRVAGQELEFSLPKGVQRGDSINLFFITNEPRQTFLMTRFGRPGDARVSDTGRWLSGFLGEAAARVSAQQTLGIMRTLLAAPPSDASHLGKVLQQGLRESGLFYESHLSRWFGGEYRLDDLLKEPQGRLSPRVQQHQPEQAAARNREVFTAEPLQPGRNASAETVESLFKKAGSTLARETVVDQRSMPVVGEQLSTLQSGQLVFRGDLFPGQKMEWAVMEREARRNQSGERERSWETSLKLNLPRLGAVSVKLDLEGTRVSMDVRAASKGTVPLLESGRERLSEQFEAAGLTAVEIGIRHGES
ncbi:MAG TPA: flagellar hook-length control protein FliK [Desulfuromonadales bacterium]|nr:flagellar hook-length control protein FliK [Desulfuromonadales bacterium]